MGTADKVAVVALALWDYRRETGLSLETATFAVVEIGSAFMRVLVVENGRIVDAAAGTRGPIGFRLRGVWDGEAAYWMSPLSKTDLFRGGVADLGASGPAAFRESLLKHVAGLKSVTPFNDIYLSVCVADSAIGVLDQLGVVKSLGNLPGATVRHAAQGAAILADGLAGGRFEPIVEVLRIRAAAGSSIDHAKAYKSEFPGSHREK